MKNRIFAILTLALTLALFAFPVFADEFVREDIIGEEVFSYEDNISMDSTYTVYNLDLEPGLYLVDFQWYYDVDVNHDGIFYLRNIHNQTYLSYKFYDYGIETFYVYISTPFSIYFMSVNGGTSFDCSIAIYNTKSYSEIYDEGYGKGHITGYENGYDVGYGVGEHDGEEIGYNKGYDEGYEAGETDGYTTGYDTGHTDGYADGKQTAQDAAYANGNQDGWNQAIKDADEVKTAIGGIFTGIFDGSVDAFNELTEGITIMGLTLKQILLTIAAIGVIGICIWLFALKK